MDKAASTLGTVVRGFGKAEVESAASQTNAEEMEKGWIRWLRRA